MVTGADRIPAIVDPDGPGGKPLHLFESGAILMYLGDKLGRFFPKETRARTQVMEWLFWQMAGVGPMFGQVGHFTRYAPEKIPYAIERYTNEAKRLVGVLDRRLHETDFVAGEYSIADMAIYPWVKLINTAYTGIGDGDVSNVKRWLEQMRARPAVERGMAILEEQRVRRPLSDEERDNLFGKKQFATHK